MGRFFLLQLDGKVYSCRICKNHLASSDQLVSKNFHSKQGKAYLFKKVVNVYEGPLEERMMTTGLHVVSDICCNRCQQVVGWKYETAHEKREKYKEGKSILELAKTVGGDCVDLCLENGPIISVPMTQFG